MSTIIDLPEEQIKALHAYRERCPKKIDFQKHPAFGSSEVFREEDSVVLVRRLRDEWE